MTIRLTCRQCGSRVSAPDALLGKKGKCPHCGEVMVIQPDPVTPTATPNAPDASPRSNVPPSSTPSPQSAVIVDDLPSLVRTTDYPRRVAFNNVYLIMNSERVVAYWKNGDGWLFQSGHGFSPARGGSSLIPDRGDFVLIEGNVQETEKGHRLVGVQFFKLTHYGALMAITRSRDEIFEKIVGRTPLLSSQKKLFLLFLRDHYFVDFTEDATDVIDYLTNEDFHSDRIGEVHNDESDGLLPT